MTSNGEGHIAVAGKYEPKSVVSLYQVKDEKVLRAEEGDLVDKRLADENGSVGFSGLDPSKRYFLTAYIKGQHREDRATAYVGEQSNIYQQAPIKPNLTPPVGTNEAVVKDPPPSLPAEELQTGLPDGVTTKVLDPQEQDDRPYDDFNPAPDASSGSDENAPTAASLPAQNPSAPDGAGSQPEASSAPTP